MKLIKTFWFIILTATLCSCGTTSSMKSADSSSNIPDLSNHLILVTMNM